MKKILNIKVFIGALLTGVLLLFAAFMYVLIARPAAYRNSESVYVKLTIIPAPTSTLRFMSSTPTLLLPAQTSSVTPKAGQIATGIYVRVYGTEGRGVSVHSNPSLESESLFFGFDSEVFLVTGGPQSKEGLIWWRLSAPNDQTRSGWVVEDYLSGIPSP